MWIVWTVDGDRRSIMLCKYSTHPTPLPCFPLTPALHSVQEDKSMRYVAGENIELLPAHEVLPKAFPLEIGKWFKRWDDVDKVFVSNIRDEYPDD